jgi:hypothetical protein
MYSKLATAIAVCGFVAAAATASAHHSFAGEFDINKPIQLQGTVTKVEWINPHAWIHIDVAGPDGSVESWAIEGGTPNGLFRRGFTRDSVKVGTVIHVDGYESRDGSRKANGRDLTLPDGTKLLMAGSRPN